MKPLKDQHGAALILELMLVTLVIILAGLAVWQHRQTPPSAARTSPSLSHAPTPAPNPYAGWQSHTDAFEQASYKYPASWRLGISHFPLGPGGPSGEIDTLTSPTGFVITLASPLQGLGGACGTFTDHQTIYSAQPLPIANVSLPVYLVIS